MTDDLEKKFKNYDPYSDEITIYYELENSYRKENETIELSHYEKEFSSIIKSYNGYETFKKTDTLNDIKKRVSEKSGFPIEVMGEFGYMGGQQYIKEKSWNIIEHYEKPETTQIKDTIYNSEYTQKRQIYIWIDILKSSKFKLLNDNANIVEIKDNITSLKTKTEDLDKKILDNKISFIA